MEKILEGLKYVSYWKDLDCFDPLDESLEFYPYAGKFKGAFSLRNDLSLPIKIEKLYMETWS